MVAFFGALLGIALLIAGGSALVRGASEIAAGFGISPLIVGLTIVGFGTSSPELMINIIGALEGETGIAFGNVVGSNICNLSLVLGVAALMMPITIQSSVVRRELPLLLLVATMMTVMAMDLAFGGAANVISRTDSLVLLAMFCIFLYFTVIQLLRGQQNDSILAEIEVSPLVAKPPRGPLRWIIVIAGCLLLLAGGEITIRSGAALASQLGVTTAVVGLFVVALGTSMPELVTSVIAALKKEPDLALGNVIGSNIFNSLIVLPASGLIARIEVPRGGLGDLSFSWVLTAALIPIFYFGGARLGRPVGIVFVVAYVVYAAVRISGAMH